MPFSLPRYPVIRGSPPFAEHVVVFLREVFHRSRLRRLEVVLHECLRYVVRISRIGNIAGSLSAWSTALLSIACTLPRAARRSIFFLLSAVSLTDLLGFGQNAAEVVNDEALSLLIIEDSIV